MCFGDLCDVALLHYGKVIQIKMLIDLMFHTFTIFHFRFMFVSNNADETVLFENSSHYLLCVNVIVNYKILPML